MKYTIWGADFDYLPMGYISALTADLVITTKSKRSTHSDCTAFAIPLGSDFIVGARVSQADNEGVTGWASIFKVEDLAARSDNAVFEAYRPIAHVSFAIDDPADSCAEELLFGSSFLLRDEADAPGLLSALIVAANADATLR